MVYVHIQTIPARRGSESAFTLWLFPRARAILQAYEFISTQGGYHYALHNASGRQKGQLRRLHPHGPERGFRRRPFHAEKARRRAPGGAAPALQIRDLPGGDRAAGRSPALHRHAQRPARGGPLGRRRRERRQRRHDRDRDHHHQPPRPGGRSAREGRHRRGGPRHDHAALYPLGPRGRGASRRAAGDVRDL